MLLSLSVLLKCSYDYLKSSIFQVSLNAQSLLFSDPYKSLQLLQEGDLELYLPLFDHSTVLNVASPSSPKGLKSLEVKLSLYTSKPLLLAL